MMAMPPGVAKYGDPSLGKVDAVDDGLGYAAGDGLIHPHGAGISHRRQTGLPVPSAPAGFRRGLRTRARRCRMRAGAMTRVAAQCRARCAGLLGRHPLYPGIEL